jgi:hypothetical protein
MFKMNTEEMAEKLRGFIEPLIRLFIDRNKAYSGEEYWASNFVRNAKLIEDLDLKQIIDKPYGVSIDYVVKKIERLVNELKLYKNDGRIPTHASDSIRDSIVYLFITYMLLKEAEIIE